MIESQSFSDQNIRTIIEKHKTTYELTQRAIFALALVETLVKTGMEFIFKGGSSLMLLCKMPRRLSTDVDILVAPGTDVENYIAKAARIFPFISCQESVGKSVKTISKKHFRFQYQSPKEKPWDDFSRCAERLSFRSIGRRGFLMYQKTDISFLKMLSS